MKEKIFREILADISKIPIFKSVPPQDIQAIIVRLKPRLFHEGEIVFKRGDTAESMFIVRYGKLAIDSPDHRDIEVTKGAIVGEMALLKHTKRPSSVKAIEETELLVLSADDFNELREKIPEFDEALKNLAAKRIKENINFLEQDNLESKIGLIRLFKQLIKELLTNYQQEQTYKKTLIHIVMLQWLFG